MPNATVTGATGSFVQIIPEASSGNTTIAQTLVTNVGSLVSSGLATFQSFNNPSSIPQPTTPTIASIGGASPTALGPINLGTLTPNVVSVLINNTGTTTLANSIFNGNQTVVGGTGGLNFTDSGLGTNINVGGGTNNVTFSGNSSGGSFTGDGTNTIVVNAKSGTTSVSATSGSADTITGTSTGGIVYTGATGSTGFINPTAGNVTVFGNSSGTQTVFGGSQVVSDGKGGTTTITGGAFTGKLTVVDGTGYFMGGAGGGNVIDAGTAGSTTLVGGGTGDVLTAGGVGDVLVASATGTSTLDGSNSAGGDTFWAGANGASLFYGSKTQSDTFYLSNSTVSGAGYKGTFISLHTGPNASLYNLNKTVANTVNVAAFQTTATAAPQYATIADFITGVDVLNISAAQGALTFSTIAPGTSYAGVVITTAAGSSITLYNNTTISSSNVTRT